MTDFDFRSEDLTLTIEEFSERFLAPAVAFLSKQLIPELFPGASTLVWFRGAYRALPN